MIYKKKNNIFIENKKYKNIKQKELFCYKKQKEIELFS